MFHVAYIYLFLFIEGLGSTCNSTTANTSGPSANALFGVQHV